MNTPTVLSDCSSRHRHRRKGSSKRAAILHSDHYEEAGNTDAKDSITSGSNHHFSSVIGVPRMAQLETLEAKMANIEVSLSTAPRRRKSGSLGGRSRDTPAKESDPLRAQLKDKENMIQRLALKDQLCTTMNINRISHKYIRESSGAPLSDVERRAAEERASVLHQDVDSKRLGIKNLKVALERLDITDNIDIRIQQAELEYQLGREELELLTLLEQSRALQILIEQDDHAKTKQDQQTIYNCISGSELVTLHAVQVEYDPKSPQFGAGPRSRVPGLWLEWALEHTGMCKGDRLLEVNGKLVLSKSKEDMLRLLSISPSPAQLVVLRNRSYSEFLIPDSNNAHNPPPPMAQVGSLRAELDALREQAEEAKRTKDGLRNDNLRLTHRISYLEEQVAELLDRNKTQESDVKLISPHKLLTSTVNTQKNVTNISITSEPNPKAVQNKSDVQVFQKGPDVTAIVANIPGLEIGGKDTVEASANLPIIRPRSNQSNISSTQIEIIGNTQKSNATKSYCNDADSNSSKKKTYSHMQMNHVHFNHKYPKHTNARLSLQPSRSSDFLSQGEDDGDSNLDKKPYSLRQSMSQHSIYSSKDHKTFDYNSETTAALEIIKKNQRQYMETNYKNLKEKKSYAQSDDNTDIIKNYKRNHSREGKDSAKMFSNLKNIETSGKSCKTNGHAKEKISSDKFVAFNPVSQKDEYIDFHPDRDYIDHRIDGKIIQNAHKSSRRLSKLHSRNVKSPDCDSEPSQINSNDERYKKYRPKHLDYTSEPNSIINGHAKKSVQYLDRPRPMPPKKPIRLSLHRAQSMQSIDPDGNQGEKFYLHDPSDRLKLANEPKNSEELRYSLSKNIIDDLVSCDKENRVKEGKVYLNPENGLLNNRLRQQTKEYSKSEEIIEYSHQSDKEYSYAAHENKRIKKRPYNGKLLDDSIFINDSEQNGGYMSSKSESVVSTPKNHKTRSHYSEGLIKTPNGSQICLSKEELRIKHDNDNSKNVSNGHVRNEPSGEVLKTSNSLVSGFKWSTPNIFKNIKLEATSRMNGHFMDAKK